jgi:hypothetical protein
MVMAMSTVGGSSSLRRVQESRFEGIRVRVGKGGKRNQARRGMKRDGCQLLQSNSY